MRSGPPLFPMPLNEAAGFTHSNLTEKQQREAERAIYGLAEERGPMSPETLTYEDRVRMRRVLDQLDQKEQAGAMKDFDLNKPPTTYTFREYPFLMYNHDAKATKPARNPEERERMTAEGWSEDPFPTEHPEIPLTAAEHAEAEAIEAKLTKKRRA